jgi:hypothetical protein
MRVMVELLEITVEGDVIAGDPLEEGSADFDLGSTFTVLCDDGAKFKIHGWMVETIVLHPSSNVNR